MIESEERLLNISDYIDHCLQTKDMLVSTRDMLLRIQSIAIDCEFDKTQVIPQLNPFYTISVGTFMRDKKLLAKHPTIRLNSVGSYDIHWNNMGSILNNTQAMRASDKIGAEYQTIYSALVALTNLKNRIEETIHIHCSDFDAVEGLMNLELELPVSAVQKRQAIFELAQQAGLNLHFKWKAHHSTEEIDSVIHNAFKEGLELDWKLHEKDSDEEE